MIVRRPSDLDESAGGRVTIEGVDVGAKAAVALTLVVHELTTNATKNAAKYGALSNDAGKLTVSRDVADGRLRPGWHGVSGKE